MMTFWVRLLASPHRRTYPKYKLVDPKAVWLVASEENQQVGAVLIDEKAAEIFGIEPRTAGLILRAGHGAGARLAIHAEYAHVIFYR